jgi:hypothetical protein
MGNTASSKHDPALAQSLAWGIALYAGVVAPHAGVINIASRIQVRPHGAYINLND